MQVQRKDGNDSVGFDNKKVMTRLTLWMFRNENLNENRIISVWFS